MKRRLPKNDAERILFYLERTAWLGWDEDRLARVRAFYWASFR